MGENETKGQNTDDLEALLRHVASAMPGVLWSTDRDFRCTWLFVGALADLNLRPDQAVGLTLFDYLATDDPDFPVIAAHRRALEGQSVSFEQDWEGRTYFASLAPLRDDRGEIVGSTGVAQDVTAHRRVQKALLASHRFLEIANRRMALPSLLRAYVSELQEVTGCASVGIRLLDDQGNMPYEVSEGFSREFCESERALSIHSDPCLCMHVALQKTDSQLPWYTEGGSFYTGGARRFFASPPEDQKQPTRNGCHQAGYESVALVPIRCDGRILGLIHVADGRENLVPLETVELVERVAVPLGTAIERIRTEQALRESEDKYRRLVEQSLQGFVVIQDFRIVFANRSFAEICGYAVESLLALSPDQLMAMVHPEDRATTWKRLEDRLAGRPAPNRYELRIVRQDGSVRWLLLFAERTQYAGKPAVEAAVLDVTESKQAEEALRESEEKFKSLAEQSPNMIFINYQGRVVYVNKKCSEVMGYGREEFSAPGFDFRMLVVPECHDLMNANFRKHTEGEEVEPVEYTLLANSGERIEAILSTKLIDYSGGKAILGTITDITERKRAEEALKESERRYHAIFEQAADSIVLIDATTGTFVEFNDRAHQSLGYTREQFARLTIADFELVESPDAVRRHLEKVIREGTDTFETQHRTKDGEIRHIQVNAAPISVHGRRVVQGIWRDMTDRKQAEEALQEAHDELERRVAKRTAQLTEANRQLQTEIEDRKRSEEALRRAERLASVGTLASGIAHEISNPLGAIALSAETALAAKTLPDGEEILEKALLNIRAAALRGGRIVKSVLQFARDGVSPKWPHDLAEVARRAHDATRKLAAENRVAVGFEIPDDLPPITLNPTEIEQVLVNLISNAIQASGPESCVTVRLQCVFDWVEILVEDRGRGMTDEEASRIFDPFYTTRQQEGGTGLGLSIAYGIVEQHGGSLEVQSKPGEGTTMKVLLPRR